MDRARQWGCTSEEDVLFADARGQVKMCNLPNTLCWTSHPAQPTLSYRTHKPPHLYRTSSTTNPHKKEAKYNIEHFAHAATRKISTRQNSKHAHTTRERPPARKRRASNLKDNINRTRTRTRGECVCVSKLLPQAQQRRDEIV